MNARHEEAAQIATEFISSLENLPQETHYLLEEIKHLDVRSEELAAKIAAETKDHFRHLRKTVGSPAGGKHSDATVPATVGRMYDELDALAAEKVELSGQLVRKFERALARLQHDLQRVLELEGGSDEPGLPPTQEFLYNFGKSVRQIEGLREAAVQELGIRSPTPPAPVPAPAAAASPSPAPAAAPSKSAPSPQKKRKTTPSAGNGKAVGQVPVVAGGRSTRRHTPVPSRSSQPPQKTITRSHDGTAPTKRWHAAIEEEKENEESENEEDNKLYCYCNEASYGEMIACENPKCSMEWFHLPCTGLKHPLPKKWYCDECKKTLAIVPAHAPAKPGHGGRKGRKKL